MKRRSYRNLQAPKAWGWPHLPIPSLTCPCLALTVSANPAGPLSRGASVTLTCQVSGPLAPDAYLSWERVNGTKMDIKNSKQREVKLEVNISTAGLWSCHLIEDSDKKISFHYNVGMEISITSLPQP